MPDLRRLAVYLGAFIGPLSGNSVLALVPTLKGEFSSTAPEILMSVSFFMIPFALFTLFSGTISDVYDRKKTVLLGFVVYAAGSLMCAASVSLDMFLLSRTVQGFGYGFVNPVLVAILGDIVPFKERGRAMGYLGAATTTGIALGPFVAGYVAIANWRLVFVLIAALILLIALVFIAVFKGVVFERRAGSISKVARTLAMGARNSSVMLLSLAGLLTFMCYVATLSFMSDVLSLEPFSLVESEIGTVMATTGFTGILAAPIGGRLVDRIGRYWTATIGFTIMIASFLLLLSSTSVEGHTASLAVLGAGAAFVWSALLTLTVEVFSEQKGTASSLFNGARFFGYALAPMAFASAYTTMGMSSVYVSSVILALAGILAVWLVSLSQKARGLASPIEQGSR